MTITLVIPVLNAESTLDGLFESIIQQSHSFDKVIFVDNGSKDRSCEKLASFQSAHAENIIVFHETSRGPGNARNRALDFCDGDIVAFTDADCLLHREWAQQAVQFFGSNPDVSILGGVETADRPRTLCEKYSAFVLASRPQRGGAVGIHSKFDWFDGRLVSTLNLAVRRQTLKELKGFALWRAGEDIDFWMRALDQGFHIQAYHPEMVVRHQHRKLLTSFARQQWGYSLAVTRLLHKHFRGDMLVATSRKLVLKTRLFTGLIEINPHTVLFGLLFLFGWKWLAVYTLFLALKPIVFLRKSQDLNFDLTLWDCILMIIPFEVFRWIVTLASLLGSIKHRVLCIR